MEAEHCLSESTAMENVTKNIFASCDTENTGLVPVARLIEFITPFMKQDLSELMELNRMLDPEGINLCVSSETFYRVMGEWTTRFKGDSSEPFENDYNFAEMTPRDLDKMEEKDLPFTQSTPRASAGPGTLHHYGESEILNLSEMSIYTLSENIPGDIHDKTYMEEQLKELFHQNRKLTDELMEVKVQLASTEEQNEGLQSDMAKLSRRLVVEQQLNEQLQNNRRESEELKDSAVMYIQQVDQLKKQLANLEKENENMHVKLAEVESEKADLEQKIEHMVNRENKIKNDFVELQKEIHFREAEIFQLEKQNAIFKQQIDEYQNTVEHYKNLSQDLSREKISLEKIINEKLSEDYSKFFMNKTASCNNASEHSDPNGDDNRLGEVHPNSSEEDLVWGSGILQVAKQNLVPHDSLHAEMVQFASGDVDTRLENGQQNCDVAIKYKQEIETLQQEKQDAETVIESLRHELHTLKSQVLFSKDKENVLIEMKSDLESKLKDSKTYVTEVRMRFSEYSDLEQKCKSLEEKVEHLEQENRRKYVEAVDLMECTEKLRKELADKINSLKELQCINEMYEVLQKEKILLEHRLNKSESEREKAKILVECYRDMKAQKDEINEKLQLTLKSEAILKSEFQSLCIKNCILKENILALESCIKTLSKVKSEMEVDNKSLKNNNEFLKDELKVKEESFIEEINNLKKQLEIANQNYDNLKSDVEVISQSLNKQLQELNLKLSEKDILISALNKERNEVIKAHKEELSQKDNEINEFLKEVEKLQCEKENLIRNFEETLNSKTKELLELIDVADKQKFKIDCLEKEYKLAKEEEMQLKSSLHKKCEEFDQVQDEIRNYKDLYNHALQQIEELTKQKEEIQYLMQQMQEDRDIIKEQKLELEKKMATIKSQKEEYVRQQNYDAELLIKLEEHLISAKKTAEEAVEKAAGQTDVLDDNKRFGTLLCLNDSLMMQKDYLTSELNKLQKIKEKQQEEILSLLKERNEWQNMKIELQRKIENCVCETIGHLASTDAESEGSLETCQNLQKRFKKNSFSKMQIKMEKLQIKIEQLESDLESEKQNCKMLELRMREKCIASTTEPVTSTEGNGTVHLELQQMQTYYETLLARKAKEYSDSYKKLDENNVKLYQQNIELNDRLEQLLEQTLLNETQNKLHCLQPTSSEINKINWKLHRSNSKLAMVLEDIEALNSHMMESSHLQSAGDILSDWRISAKDMELDVSLATEFETLSNLAHYTEVLADLVCLYIVHLRKASKMDISGSSERGLCRSGKKFTLKPPTLVLPMSPDSPAETQKSHKFAEFPTSVKQNSVDQMHSVFEDNRAFPSLPDDLLKNLGLLGENSCQDWTEEEMEQKFAVLMMSFKIDMSTIKYRFTKVTQDLQQKQYYISNEMQELLSLINKQMTDIVAVKAKMEGIMDAFSVVSTLTQLCGAIQEEKRVIKAFTMVHNYILMLRQRTGNRHQPIECVRCCQKQEEYKPTARTTNCVKKLSSGLLFVLSALGLVVIANILLKVCTHAGLLSSRYFWDDSLWEEIFAPIQVYKTKEGVPPH